MVVEIKKEEFFMKPIMIPTAVRVPQQKIIYADTPWKLDKEVNDFIENITEKGFKVIAISVNTNRQEYYHYTTTIVYGVKVKANE